MNYFMFVTSLALLVSVLAIRSLGQQQYPDPYGRRIIGCSRKLDIYRPNANGQWPSKARKIKFEMSSNNGKLKLSIQWIANITNVNGFKIILKSTDRPDICIIFNYTNTVKKNAPNWYFFSNSLTMSKKHKNLDFTGMLFPLPSPDNASQVAVFHTWDCSNVIPRFTYEYDGRNLIVTVYKGPAKCNFKEYIIQIYNNGTSVASKIIPTQDNVDKLKATIDLKICREYYTIMVGPYDRYFNDDSRCVCKDIDNLCRTCLHSISKDYMIPARSCSLKVAPPEKPVNNAEVYGFQICIGLLLVVMLALSLAHWKLNANLMARKRGIVLFLDDHEPHTNAVTKLVKYLNECHLRVSLASIFLQNPDIPNQLVVITEALKSDFILLVLSNALQKRMAVWDKQQDYVEFFKEVNSNILTKPFLEILLESNKLYVCKFDHVAEFGHWPKPCYSLPTDLTRMTTDLSGRSCSQRMILCYCRKFSSLSHELHKGIQKSILYEQSYENWFQEKYVCPRNVTGSYIAVDETSRTESFDQDVSSQKLKKIFTIYRDKFTESTAHPIITESICSEAVSLNLEEINARNLQL